MKSDILSNTDLLLLPQISVVLFVGIFLGAMFWIYRPGSKQSYAQRAQMPLTDGEPVPTQEKPR